MNALFLKLFCFEFKAFHEKREKRERFLNLSPVDTKYQRHHLSLSLSLSLSENNYIYYISE